MTQTLAPVHTASALPPGLPLIAALVLLVGGFGPNVDLALLATFVLVAGALLLWRPGEAPILLLAFVMQWLQSSIAVFHANWLGEDVAAYSSFGGSTRLAIELSEAALLVFAAGMRLGTGASDPSWAVVARFAASSVPARRWFQLYASLWTVSFFGLSFAWIAPGLTQPLLALTTLRWAAFFLLAYGAFSGARGTNPFFVIAFAFEFIQGIGAYFSDFKTVFFVTLLARASVAIRVSAGAIIALTGFAAALLALGIVWTAVKGEFRGYLSGGTSAQVVTVGLVPRLQKLAELVEQLDADRLADATSGFLHRVSYVEFFGVVLDTVPDAAPYAGGAIWWDAVSRPFEPRLLFADKSAISDPDRTMPTPADWRETTRARR